MVGLLPYSTRALGLILSMGAVCTEFGCSPHDHMGFPGCSSFLPHTKGIQVCRLIVFGKISKLSLGTG